MDSFTKQVGESYPIFVDFKDKLPPGVALSAASIAAVDTADNSDVSATVLVSTVGAIVGTRVRVGVRGGTDGSTYKLSLFAYLNSGSIAPLMDYLKEDILMIVSNP